MKKLIGLFFTFLFVFSLYHSQLRAQSGAGFWQNQGQWEGGFKFKANVSSSNFFIDANGYTMLQYNPEDVNKLMGHHQSQLEKRIEPVKITPPGGEVGGSSNEDLVVRKHAYRVSFLGGTNRATYAGENPTGHRANFILGNDPSKWKSDVESFSTVRVKNMYPGIDVKYYTYNDRIKFDILVEPGANPSAIKLKYEGADKIEIVKGELLITTSLGVVKELKPYAYQVIAGSKVEIPCSYQLINNQVSYKLQGYNKSAPLVIDPEILWLSTYTGSTTANWGYTAAPGPDKSIYAAGIVIENGYPVTYGRAFQEINNTDPRLYFGWDIAISRIARNGNDPLSTNTPPDKGFIFSTYIGGSDEDYPHSLIVDDKGDVIILGRTKSGNSFPHKKKWGSTGNWDIFVFKLSSDGKLDKGSMLIGGSLDDGYNHEPDNDPIPLKSGTPYRLNYGDCSRSEVIIDNGGNIFIASNTKSNDFLPTTNARSNKFKGVQDGVLLKIDPTVTQVIYSTFLGGKGFDAAVCLGFDKLTNRVFVGGYTESSDFDTKGPVISERPINQLDGFLSIFNNDGSLHRSTYLGTSSIDYIYAVQVDDEGYPYILGVSYGNWEVKNAPVSTPNGKQFVSKLEKDLEDYVFSNRFGSGTGNIHDLSPIAFLVDQCKRIFIAGFVNSPDSYCKPNLDAKRMIVKDERKDGIYSSGDGRDFYFIVFDPDCSDVKFASFWGQQNGIFDHVDGGTSRFDKQGVIYMASCANCPVPSTCEPVDLGYLFPMRNQVDVTKRRPRNDGLPCNLHALILDFGLGTADAQITPFADGIEFKRTGCDILKARLIGSSSGERAVLPSVGVLPSEPGVSYSWDIGYENSSGTFISIIPAPLTGKDVSYDFSFNPNIPEYKVILTVVDQNKVCKNSDVTSTTIKVGNIKADLKARYDGSCSNPLVTFINESSPASLAFGPTSFRWDIQGNIFVNGVSDLLSYRFPGDGTYKAKLRLDDPNFCNNGDEIELDVFILPDVVASLSPLGQVCIDRNTGKAKVEFIGGGGPNIKWKFLDNLDVTIGTAIGTKTTFEFITPGDYKIELDVSGPPSCPDNDVKPFDLKVFNTPVANFSFSTPQENTPVQFTNLSDNLSLSQRTFLWDFRDGETASDVNPSHIFTFSRRNEVKLLTVDKVSGCRDSIVRNVFSKVVPLVNIPNAFTPLEPTNKTFGIIGYGIISVDLKIYNRWGVKVFDSETSRFKNWDGTYNGQLQPMDVYTYIAQVSFSDGESQTLKGEVTLIR